MPSPFEEFGQPDWATSLLNTAACGMLVLSSEGEILWANPWFCNLIGRTPIGDFRDCMVETGGKGLDEILATLLASDVGDATDNFSTQLIGSDDRRQAVSLSLSKGAVGQDGNTLINATVTLISDLEAAEQERILLQEILHRTKNLLAVIQSMASQTARGHASKQDFVAQLKSRIQGLSATHDLLVRHNWRPVLVNDLVNRQMRTLIASQDMRISAEGPELRLAPQFAQPLGLALHELLANALQHGALSNDAGRVVIEWNVDEDDANEAVEFRMSWLEQGGPPVVEPDKFGFGRIVTTDMLEQSLGCVVGSEFQPSGFSWNFHAPFAVLISGNDHVRAPSRNY